MEIIEGQKKIDNSLRQVLKLKSKLEYFQTAASVLKSPLFDR
jgi:hypothetical protein